MESPQGSYDFINRVTQEVSFPGELAVIPNLFRLYSFTFVILNAGPSIVQLGQE